MDVSTLTPYTLRPPQIHNPTITRTATAVAAASNRTTHRHRGYTCKRKSADKDTASIRDPQARKPQGRVMQEYPIKRDESRCA